MQRGASAEAVVFAAMGEEKAQQALLGLLRRAALQPELEERRRQVRELQRLLHPDKWPRERQALATKLFQVLQSRREATLAGRLL